MSSKKTKTAPSGAANQAALRKLNRQGSFKQICGWIIALLCGFTTVAGLSAGFSSRDIWLDLFFLALTLVGVFLIISGNRMKKLARLYPVYAAHIAKTPYGDIDAAAATLGLKPDVFRKRLTAMQKHGIYVRLTPSAAHTRVKAEPPPTVPTAGSQPRSAHTPAKPEPPPSKPPQPPQPPAAVRFHAIKCPNCGAPNKVVSGTVIQCRYCGSHLSAPHA